MKKLLTISFLLPILSFAQLSDTTCVKYRWIALKPTEINKDIFQLDEDSDKDLVQTIKHMVEFKAINIYSGTDSPYNKGGWYPLNYDETLRRNEADSLRKYENTDPYFEIVHKSYTPLSSIWGEDSIRQEANGDLVVVYPKPRVYTFQAKECDEIRIKEERYFNEITKKFEFRAIGLSFFFNGIYSGSGRELFWVDLKEVFAALEGKERYVWYKPLIEKTYQGFQYMQISFYDDDFRY